MNAFGLLAACRGAMAAHLIIMVEFGRGWLGGKLQRQLIIAAAAMAASVAATMAATRLPPGLANGARAPGGPQASGAGCACAAFAATALVWWA